MALVNGVATTPSISTLTVGAHAVTPVYIPADGRFLGSTSFAGGVTISPASWTTVVASSAPASVYGQSITFSATVSPNAPSTFIPTGTVQFQLDGVNFGDPAPLVNGVATTAPIGTLSAGNHVVTTTYFNSNGDASGEGSLASGQAVAKAPLTIVADDAQKAYGAAIPPLTAHYIGFVNGDAPANLDAAPTLSTTATTASAPGVYPINAAGQPTPTTTSATSPDD